MPDGNELEMRLEEWEISQLEKMDRAAKMMDAHDEEEEEAVHGYEQSAAGLG